jgi:hypothetical protein
MDLGTTISRAFNIVLKHRVLWVLGFLAALAGGSGGGSSFNFNLPPGSFGSPGGATGGEFGPEVGRFFETLANNSGVIIAGALGLFCVLFVISIALWVISIIANGGLIGGVDQIERDGSTTFGQAWAMGARKFWPLLGLNILLALPIIILLIVGFVLVGGSLFAIVGAAMAQDSSDAAAATAATAGFGALCIGGVLACVGFIYSLLASALQTFGERAIVLDGTGVMDSLRKGWEVFRSNLGNIILLALVMLVISIVVGFVVGLVSAALLLPVLFTGFIGAANNPDTFSIGAGTIILAAFAFIAVAIIAAIIGALFKAFNSAAWTLAYRQFTGRGMPMAATPTAPLPTV